MQAQKLRFLPFLFGILLPGTPQAAQTCNPNVMPTTPENAFTDHGNGTVTHNRTGLMWMKCVLGQSGSDCTTGSANAYTWDQALQTPVGFSYAGYSDWRVPNIKELASIAETACYSPAINLSVFPNTPASYVWSASPSTYGSNLAWLLSFDYGYDYTYYKSNDSHVRLVRGGQ